MNYSRLITITILLSTVVSIGMVYRQYIVKGHFLVKYKVPCDQTADNCFIHDCDESLDECTGDVEQDTSYYTLMYRLANNIPSCEDDSSNCQEFTECGDSEEGCRKIFCDESVSQIEGAECSNSEDLSSQEEDVTENLDRETSSKAENEGADSVRDDVIIIQ